MDKKYIAGFIVAICVVFGAIIFINYRSQDPTLGLNLVPFAQCLKEKKVIFFGAFWCPHCQATKKMFGVAAKDLPYTECSNADGNSQTQVCIDNKIQQYPTWQFADGSRITGEQTLQALADKSGCALPADLVTNSASSTPTAGTSSATIVQ